VTPHRLRSASLLRSRARIARRPTPARWPRSRLDVRCASMVRPARVHPT